MVTGNVKADGLRLGRPWSPGTRRATESGSPEAQAERLAGVTESDLVIVDVRFRVRSSVVPEVPRRGNVENVPRRGNIEQFRRSS